MVIAHGLAWAPGQLRWESTGPERTGHSQVQLRIGKGDELPTRQRDPRERQDGRHEPRQHARRRANPRRRAPRQDRPQPEGQAPADGRAGKPGDGVEHEVRDEAPERQTNHQALRQRHPLVVLAQRHSRHHIAHRGQRGELRQQQQEARHDREINAHSGRLRQTAADPHFRLNR